MTWMDWIIVVLVAPSYAFLLSWLMMSDGHVDDIKYVFRRLTKGRNRMESPKD